jgi:MFS family permease
LTAILLLHTGAAELGVLQTALWSPWLLFALVTGSYVDRHRRRPVLITADAGRALTVATIVVLALTKTLSIVALAGLMFVLGSLTVLFEVTYQSYLPTVVEESQLVTANASLQATASVAAVGGPSIGGLLVQALSAPVALIVDASSYVVSVLSLTAIDAVEAPPELGVDRGRLLARVLQGLAFTYRNPMLRGLIGVAATYNFFSEWILTLFLIYGIHDRHLGASGLGLVLAFGAVGAVVGSAAAASAVRSIGVGNALFGSVVLECAALALLPLISGSPLVATVMFALLFGLNGIGVALSSVVAVSIRQTATPPGLLGRMTASYRFVSYGSVALGAMLGGAVGQLTNLRVGIAIGGIGCLSTVAWIVCTPLWRLRGLVDPDPP